MSGSKGHGPCWAVAKLVRHQALDLAFEGSNPSRPAIIFGRSRECGKIGVNASDDGGDMMSEESRLGLAGGGLDA
jgi:hypothetical protein